jgi:hypothetical protein
LVGGKKSGELVSAKGSQGHAKEAKDARDLSGKLHRDENDRGERRIIQPSSQGCSAAR